jgi:hypothetical protein
MNWKEHTAFAALDFAREHHDLLVIDRDGKVLESLRFEHSEAGWKQLNEVAAK